MFSKKWLFLAFLAFLLALLIRQGILNLGNGWPWTVPLASSTPEATQFLAQLPAAPSLSLPPDSGYVNVKDFGAKGDGVTDDTAVLRKTISRSKESGAIRSIYFPNGTYLVSDTLEWGDKRKDVRGQSRDGVVIKLKDNAPGFQNPNRPKKVLQVEFGHGGQNFDQHLSNLTVDVGRGNPGAIGIGFHTNNTGGIRDVVIRSSDPQKRGHTGLSLDKAWPGPGLIHRVAVDGFEIGIFVTHDQYSMTFETITLTNQRQVGFVNSWNTVAIHNLSSRNRVPAVENRGKMALMALVGADLREGDVRYPAIVNHSEGVLFARDIRTKGYGQAILHTAKEVGANLQSLILQSQSSPPTDTVQTVDEFVSHPVSNLFPGAKKSLRLPIEDPPVIPYGEVKTWVSITQYGAKPDDDKDDGAALQRAIEAGAETIYLPAGVYRSQQTIRVHKNVRRLFGLNAQMIFDTPGQPGFKVEDGKYDAVAIDIDSTYGDRSRYWIEHASQRTLVLGNGSYINTVPGGKVFMEDASSVPLIFNRQQVWLRQINPESYDHNPSIVNNGGRLWVLGLKTEKDRTAIGTYQGGQTEVLGGLLYKNRERVGPAPAFISEDSAISLIYRNKGVPYQVQVQETRQGARREFLFRDLPASDGRMPLYVGGN
ncbi:hypothetical protein BST81_00285 [Leptolyngbya sp. 'hensonii']|uniref:glycoside hydrolase family 55 protein n=1 Tax=Leptolyngbya sp. 'hensonii' TaxID=1922337 RepID=UPI00094F657F|nr:glycoside hydrolase family 55 protein [Leptolyngbya sp. 'hensonii']OLP20483.1 hypothetical protein BST81_00285 [Leptolyngbya sp. 'hensonii']